MGAERPAVEMQRTKIAWAGGALAARTLRVRPVRSNDVRSMVAEAGEPNKNRFMFLKTRFFQKKKKPIKKFVAERTFFARISDHHPRGIWK